MKLFAAKLAAFLALAGLAPAQSFVVNSLIVGTPDPAPTLTTATLGPVPTTLTLAFSENVFIGSGGNGGFTPTLSGGAATLTYASGSGSNELIYTVSRSVAFGETGTLAYTQPGNGVEDSIGSDLASLSGFTLTNTISSEPDTTTTSIPHDEMLDGFQNATTGYELTWTESGTTANISKPYDSTALSSGKPTGAANRALRIVQPTDGTETFASWNRGSNIARASSALDFIFYVYVDSTSSGYSATLARVTNITNSTVMSLELTESAGTLTLQATGSTSSSAATISQDTWVKVHIHLDTTAANCYLQINDGGTTNTFTRASQDYGILRLGAIANLGAGETSTILFDLVCWNTP